MGSGDRYTPRGMGADEEYKDMCAHARGIAGGGSDTHGSNSIKLPGYIIGTAYDGVGIVPDCPDHLAIGLLMRPDRRK
jgi:hypothetical protein